MKREIEEGEIISEESIVKKQYDIVLKDNERMKLAKESFQSLLEQYISSNPLFRQDGKINEFELRFGTNTFSGRQINKIDYDNVVKRLLSSGFLPENAEGIQILRINYQDTLSDENKMSNIRAEIVGIDMVQEYCKTNSIQKIIDMPSTLSNKIKFTRKSSIKDKAGNWQKPVDMFDMNFRADYKLEENFNIKVPFIRDVISTWGDRKKTFRFMNRTRFYHPDYPVFVDLSILKTSKKYVKQFGGNLNEERRFKPYNTSIYIPKYNIQEAGVFTNTESYEIEMEIDNSRVGNGTSFDTSMKLMDVLRTCTRIILSGIQKCNYPISFSERDQVLNEYMKIIRSNSEDEYQYKKININNKKELFENFVFIGPGSITLQREHIVEKKEGSLYPSVLTNYTVTDKADGERKLLFINKEGRIYLIDNILNVEFTGLKTSEKTIYNSVLDGEHIKNSNKGEPIQLYGAFDVYYVAGKNFREKMFYPDNSDDLENNFRLPILKKLVDLIKPSSLVNEKKIIKWKEIKNKQGIVTKWIDLKSGVIVNVKPIQEYTCLLRIETKHFEVVNENKTIFECCANIMKRKRDNMIKYHTDGLIFTPTNVGVGGSGPGLIGPLNSSTWELSFKWKPVEQNTVDFLVTVKKDPTGKDEVLHIFQDGKNTQGLQNIKQYKTLELMCGYSERDDGILNPYNDLIDDKIPLPTVKIVDSKNKKDYIPYLFQPNDPYDINAGICKILLKDDGTNLYMMSEEGEYFEDLTIVEFRYDTIAKNWIPLRVRYDKTQKLRNGEKQYGNAYRVANSNWRSIHYPITEEMITTGENIPETIIDDGVYYKGNEKNNTQSLRDFHNLYIKKKLIMAVSSRGDTLIDYAVGMGGDLSKWISAKLSFVFGIDVSAPNIHDQKRGACSRYLNLRRDNNEMPDALFVVGDSGLNIRNGIAFPGDGNKDKIITNAIFGKGPKDATIIGKGTYKRYGIGEHGFNVSSCQFALHYFFENPVKMHGFMRNLAECTKEGGYFIGTCYDGASVFKLLSNKSEGESIVFMTEDKNGQKMKICEIVKKYGDTGFPDDVSSLGYPIDVYQESINKMAREYLVNFSYLVQVLDNYGFTLISKDEARQFGLPNNTGLFDELFSFMKNEIRQHKHNQFNYKDAAYMSNAEKSISFLNRYFIFKKTTHIDAAKVSKILLSKTSNLDFDDTNIDVSELEMELRKQQRNLPVVKGEIKKLKIKVKLQKVPSEIFSILSDPVSLDITEEEPVQEKGKGKKRKSTNKINEKLKAMKNEEMNQKEE